jgi:3-hydroxyisobutyrate dehydrogenase-like beta-hydroxyacid dehydrogenase
MSTTKNPRLGWIGLGSMGLAMANNIQKHLKQNCLPSLQYWNRTLSRGVPLKELGGVPCQSVEGLVQSCDVIFVSVSMLPFASDNRSSNEVVQVSDDEALKSLITSIIDSGSIKDKIIIDTTTVHPSTTTQITQQISAANASYIAAPVFGSTPVALSGHLLIAVAGPPDAISTTSPFLKNVIARAVIEVGPEPAKALVLKTTSNFITAGLMLVLSEAHNLASLTGLPADVLSSLVEQNFGTYAAGVSERITTGAYCPAVGEAPRSGLELGIKDVGHGVSSAREAGMELKIGEMYLEAAHEAKTWAEDEGKGRKMDSSSVFGVVRKRAGLEFETDIVKERGARGGDTEEQ